MNETAVNLTWIGTDKANVVAVTTNMANNFATRSSQKLDALKLLPNGGIVLKYKSEAK